MSRRTVLFSLLIISAAIAATPVVSAADDHPPEPPETGGDETCQRVSSVSDPSGTYSGQIDAPDDYDYIFRTPVEQGDIVKVTVPPTPYSGDLDVNMRMLDSATSDDRAISMVGLENAETDFSADVPSAVVGVAGNEMTVSFYAEESGVMCLDVDENGAESTVYDWTLDVEKNPQQSGTGDTDGDGVDDAEDYAPRDPDVQTEPTSTPVPDTDGDGVDDAEDYAPRDPDVQTEPDETAQSSSPEPAPGSSGGDEDQIAGWLPSLLGAFGLGVGASWITQRVRSQADGETAMADRAGASGGTDPWVENTAAHLRRAEEHRKVANEAFAEERNTVAKVRYRDARDAYREAIKELDKHGQPEFDIGVENQRFTSKGDVEQRLEDAEDRLDAMRTSSA